MLEVNLIRWRSSQRQYQYRQFIVCILLAILLALLFVWNLYVWSKSDVIRQREILQQEVVFLKQVKLPSENERLSLSNLDIYQQQYMRIKSILLSHYQARELFKSLDELLPPKVILTQLHFKNNQLWLKGVSHSNNSLTEFLDRLGQFALFQQPKISFSLQNNIVSLPNDSYVTPISLDVERSKYFEIYVLLNNGVEV